MRFSTCTRLTCPVVTVCEHIGSPFWILFRFWYPVTVAKTAEPAKNLMHSEEFDAVRLAKKSVISRG